MSGTGRGDRDDAVDISEAERGGFGSLGSIVMLLALTWAAGIASFPLNDNSFFTHLATGRIILTEGRIPTSDPYTFTAAGEPWTVQSWLASVAYAGAEQLAGGLGLRVLVLAIFLVAMSVMWKLTGPARSIIVRLLLVGGSLFVITDLWSARPYMMSVIGLGVVWLAMEGAVRPWLMVPLFWIWANVHGAFPLGLVLAVCLAVGAWLDRRSDVSDDSAPADVASLHRRVLGAMGVGTVTAAIGPLGPRLLLFPLTALSKSDLFAEIVEWRAPTFRPFAERAFLVFALVTIVLITRRASWRLTVPAVVFFGAAVVAQRNVVLATVVLVAVAARSAPSVGTLTSDTRPATGRALAGVLALLFLAVCAVAVASPTTALGGYPARALAWLGPDAVTETRVAEQVFTGNLLEVLDGPTGSVFVDDRVDMFPERVFRGALRLGRGEPGWQEVLDDDAVQIVVWERAEPAASLLVTDEMWRVVYTDTSWIVACRRAAGCAVLEGRSAR